MKISIVAQKGPNGLRRGKNNIAGKFVLFSVVLTVGIFLWTTPLYASAITPENIIELTNQKREETGLPKLTMNPSLQKAAHKKAEDIFEAQTFAHNLRGQPFTDWIERGGYEYRYAGENLAVDFQNAENIIAAWMDSPSHKENLIDTRYQEIGVAAVEGEFQGQTGTVVVQMLGTPRSEHNASADRRKDPSGETNTKKETTREETDSSSTQTQTSISPSSEDRSWFIKNFFSQEKNSIFWEKYGIIPLIFTLIPALSLWTEFSKKKKLFSSKIPSRSTVAAFFVLLKKRS